MPDLTPEAIADYPLRTGVRGYRVDEVDELLDRVADQLERLQARLQEQHEELERARARAAEATETEDTLRRTLVTAQRTAEETVAEAEQEAERIRREAREEAEQQRASLDEELRSLRETAVAEAEEAAAAADRARRDADLRITQLRGVAERFRTQMQDHLDAHRALLAEVPLPRLDTADEPDDSDQAPDGTAGAGATTTEPARPSPFEDTTSALFPGHEGHRATDSRDAGPR